VINLTIFATIASFNDVFKVGLGIVILVFFIIFTKDIKAQFSIDLFLQFYLPHLLILFGSLIAGLKVPRLRYERRIGAV
jgi:uncharacterized integral membrane protein